MREIDFRIFDKCLKKYHYTHNMHNGKGFGTLLFNLAPPMVSDDFVVEQYTGLKDKNGKDIYEGDIVHACFQWRCVGGTVAYIEEVAAFGIIEESLLFSDHDPNIWEVVGNIYENPEMAPPY